MANLDLYHRTSPEAAAAILRDKRMTSKERNDVFFSTHRGGEQTGGYGSAVVHVRVPEHIAELDDEFPSGEQHYRLDLRNLKPHHFVGVRVTAGDGDDAQTSAPEVNEKDAHRLRFDYKDWESGGSKWPTEARITAVHPDHGAVGFVNYLIPRRSNGTHLIKRLEVDPKHTRKGYGSALMDDLQARHPKARIDHGDRTDAGKAWWSGYGQGKADPRGRTAVARPFGDAPAESLSGWSDLPGATAARVRSCAECHGLGERPDGSECGVCDGSGRDPECGCGRGVELDPVDGWQHLDGSVSHDTPDGRWSGLSVAETVRAIAGRSWQRPGDRMTRMHPRELLEHIPGEYHRHPVTEQLADSMRTHGWDPERGREHVEERFGNVHEDENPVTLWHTDQGSFVEPGNHRVPAAARAGLTSIPVLVKDQRTRREAAFAPHLRLFGPTYGLDHRLFDGDHLKPDVTSYILGTLDRFWQPLYGAGWTRWARVYFAGSEASEWTSPTLEGNNDFDVLVGVEYDRARHDVKQFVGMDNQEITDLLNHQFRERLIPKTDPTMITVEGTPQGPFSNTWYVNPDSWDIRKIKPYAAYDVTNHEWAVKPPHLPEWNMASFPEGHALLEMGQAYEKLIKAIFALPEPYRTQQANALWTYLHSDRSRAFGPNGEGWYDPGNAMEKYLDQSGLWADLFDYHHRAEQDPTTLLAPAGWSNDPGTS